MFLHRGLLGVDLRLPHILPFAPASGRKSDPHAFPGVVTAGADRAALGMKCGAADKCICLATASIKSLPAWRSKDGTPMAGAADRLANGTPWHRRSQGRSGFGRSGASLIHESS